jgi:hypothetical protein
MTHSRFGFNDMPRFNESRIKRRKVKAYVPAELRPSERLAHLAALEEAAVYDAQGIDAAVVTYRERGECLVMVDGKVVAWTFAVTDEPPVIETATAEFRERLRQATAELDEVANG